MINGEYEDAIFACVVFREIIAEPRSVTVQLVVNYFTEIFARHLKIFIDRGGHKFIGRISLFHGNE